MSRLRAELRRLRKQYQEQTEMSKREFMNVHSKKVSHKSLIHIKRIKKRS